MCEDPSHPARSAPQQRPPVRPPTSPRRRARRLSGTQTHIPPPIRWRCDPASRPRLRQRAMAPALRSGPTALDPSIRSCRGIGTKSRARPLHQRLRALHGDGREAKQKTRWCHDCLHQPMSASNSVGKRQHLLCESDRQSPCAHRAGPAGATRFRRSRRRSVGERYRQSLELVSAGTRRPQPETSDEKPTVAARGPILPAWHSA
mmetsp:Transcript_30032/g.82430  ORF Transcript_30032/g.82430 Transcript_30032/m.82430 type:complete len:204 (+) Transcript_30032:847-1458(+)